MFVFRILFSAIVKTTRALQIQGLGGPGGGAPSQVAASSFDCDYHCDSRRESWASAATLEVQAGVGAREQR